jgi:hypothetical protein
MGTYAPSYSDSEVCEVQGSIREDFGEEDITCSVTLQCAWDIRHAVVEDIVGNYMLWPHMLGFARAPYAQTAGIVPLDSKGVTSGQSITYEDALITVNYGFGDGEDPEDLFSESLEPTAEFITLDYKKFSWINDTDDGPGDALLEGEAPGKLLRGMNLVRTVFKVTSLPPALLTCFGCVNAATYVSGVLGFTFNEETLLYNPPTTDRTINTAGTDGWNIQLRFGIKPEGWNKFWRSKTQTWEVMWDNEAEQEYKSYPTGDFSSLLF